METLVKAKHDINCECQDCMKSVMAFFKGFNVESARTGSNRGIACPVCRCRIRARKFGVWLVWSCWRESFEVGVVTNFREEADKLFGFAKINDPTSAFFHNNRRLMATCDGDDWVRLVDPKDARYPKVGEEIIIQVFQGEKSPKALWWSFKDEYEQALQELENRPTYRLVHRIGYPKNSKLTHEPAITVRCEGKNLYMIRYNFPKEDFPVYDNGSEAQYFEIQDHAGNWIESCDPR